jgi:hypothetical protein
MQVTIRDAGDLKAVNRALGRAANGKELKQQLRQNLRGQIRPIVARVKLAWRTAPSMGRPHPGRPPLRRLLANATRGQVRLARKEAGVRVRTDGRRMPAGMKALPTYAEGTKRPWRHPVGGDRDTWVTQRPFPQFFDAVRPDEAQARREVERAVEAIFRQIVRAK